MTISKQEIKGLLGRVQTMAQRQGLTSVHSFKTCMRHLETALRLQSDQRVVGVRHAHTHFQFLKAAAAEKATRGKA